MEIGLLTPNSRGYSQLDIEVIEAISRFRAGGYDEQIGFTVYDTLRYKRAMEELVRRRWRWCSSGWPGRWSPTVWSS